MPKQFALGLTVRHLTGSSRLLDLLNEFGHAASHSSVLELDTTLASMQMQQNELIPVDFKENTFTTLVWDNNDFGEETLSGKGTTHNANGIIIQKANIQESMEDRFQRINILKSGK